MLREWLKWQCYVFILYVGMEICERDGDGDGDEERARVRARTPRWHARARISGDVTLLTNYSVGKERK